MRSEFEKIEDIKERLKLCYFDRDQNSYLPHSQFDYGSASYLRGAWLIYQHQQSKVDELQLKLSEESRILHNVIDIGYKKRDELQKQIKEQDLRIKRLIESEENFERSCASYRALTNKALDEKEELQKRVDVLCKKWKEDLNNPYLSKDAREFFCLCVDELEQALKGEKQ
ncbi:hypothetical protein [Acinetobacter beijerinckii]|uniref:hypothetical protein n=1 Tax=Acinetobacter beijerinckii TaxID=262668 RepID=UPI00300BB2DC